MGTVGGTVRSVDNGSLVRALGRGAVVVGDGPSDVGGHAVGISVLLAAGHAVVCAVEGQFGDTIVTLDAGGFLKAGGDIVGDFAEDADLTLDDFFLVAILHVTRNIADEAFTGWFIPDFLPEGARSVEVFRTDLGEEGDGIAGEVAVSLVKVNGSFAELDGLDRGKIVGAGSLVEERHLAVTLEVSGLVSSA